MLRKAITLLFLLSSCGVRSGGAIHDLASPLRLKYDEHAGTISVIREGQAAPLLVQHARRGTRPYIHPIMAPDGNGALTELSPAHHPHQTGLYWGLKKVNGRDYFMNWKDDHWKRIAVDVVTASGKRVEWMTQYQLLDAGGNGIMTETQHWSFEEQEGRFLLDMTWQGTAHTNVTMGKFYVGGLFLRMPWYEGIEGQVVNANGERNSSAEGQRALWTDVAMQIQGRGDPGHIAILDHPDNKGFPVAWRVDNELGVGPSRQILGDWTIPSGQSEVFRYRLVVYTGRLNPDEIQAAWKNWVCE